MSYSNDVETSVITDYINITCIVIDGNASEVDLSSVVSILEGTRIEEKLELVTSGKMKASLRVGNLTNTVGVGHGNWSLGSSSSGDYAPAGSLLDWEKLGIP